jgi:uncharacterized membrane protein (UPF0127 family)
MTDLLIPRRFMLVLCVLVVQVACSPKDLPVLESSPSLSPPIIRTDSIPAAAIGDHSFSLEIADTPDERAVGLMGRDTLPLETAMLFVFETERTWPFWMKNTSILLDILWINSSGKIVDIQTMYPEPGKPDKDLTVYEPASPALYALEINGGLAKKYGFSPGTLVQLSLGADRSG